MNPDPVVRLLDLENLTVFEHEAMTTNFRLHLAAPTDESSLRPIAEEAFRLLDRVEEKLSFYREGSDVTRINRAAEDEVLRIDEITHRCLLKAFEVAAASDGALDPFSGYAALRAKGQSIPAHLADLPAPAAGEATPVLSLDPDQPIVTKLGGRRWLDLGAVGKGAALDAMADLLREWSVPSAVLEGGGSSILALGHPPSSGEDRWNLVLLQSPGQPRLPLEAPFALGASGDGFQPGHIIGPEGTNARPQSLVLAPNAAVADALSTASLLLSEEKLRELMGTNPRYGLIATHASEPIVSTGVFASELSRAPVEVSLVIPCWCESLRLPPFLRPLASELTDRRLPVEILVVDDASPVADAAVTRQEVAAIRQAYPMVRPLETADRHRGKGAAVYWGWERATSLARWLALVDADGAVPVAAVVEGIERALGHVSGPLPIIAGTRYHHDPDRPVQRGFWRQRTGGWFARWAQRQLDLGAVDSQCGFKIVPAAWWRNHAEPWAEEGYAFDLELFQAAKADGITVENLPISWQEIGGSHVSISDGLRLVGSVRRRRHR